jgi:DNA topoisomerase VI subunit B
MEKKKETGAIKQGSIAEFMRKRTQLVGFDFGLNKHTQYAIEFIDNSLDAIESFHWKILRSKRPEYAFVLKDDLLLESFSYLAGGVTIDDLERIQEEQTQEQYDDEGNLLDGDGLISLDESDQEDETLIIHEDDDKEKEEQPVDQEGKEVIPEDEDEEAKELRKLQKKEDELEQEVQTLVAGMEGFLFPVEAIVDREPFVIIQLTEREAEEVYADMSQKNQEVFEYSFEIFDNGTGMGPDDLEKFGKYLASSKSQKLKQTRGSQGFGSPSAFSDAQNTTGQPVTVVSKSINHLYGTCTQFYTTSKNNKEYVVPPTEVDCPFSHGTYVSLKYMNVRYRKGYIDQYINQTALTNPHVTIIYLDPQLNETIYPRRVGRFPKEPTYALPHPSSVNIGDFQDLLRGSTNLTVNAFLQDNFVRLSSPLAKTIIEETEEDLENIITFFNFNSIFVKRCTNLSEPIHILKFENRVFGRSKKPREILVTYLIEDESNKEAYWNLLNQFNDIQSKIESKRRKTRTISKKIVRETVNKIVKAHNSEIKALEKEIKLLHKQLVELKKKLEKLIKTFKLSPDLEISDVKITDKMEEAVSELLISKAKPSILSQKQTESLFKIFKNQKFMSPPTDTAIPIGSSTIETTLLKEFGLKLPFRTDLFLDYSDSLEKLTEDESETYPSRILAKFKNPNYMNQEELKAIYDSKTSEEYDLKTYDELLLMIDAHHAIEDDFIAGNTRQPTSGKGLAFVVEAAIAISTKIPQSKKMNQVLMRYVNRTPKMRDNADCAIWKGVQSVNWKNYKLDTFDNGIPKGHVRVLVNISGPYVHLMFKSQSKNALAEDEVLLKEIKFCLEAIGRKIRSYQLRKVRREKTRTRSKTIEKFIPIFVSSLVGLTSQIDSLKEYKASYFENRIKEALDGKIDTPEEDKVEKVVSASEVIEKKPEIETIKVITPEPKIQEKSKEKSIVKAKSDTNSESAPLAETKKVKENSEEIPKTSNQQEPVKTKLRTKGSSRVKNINDILSGSKKGKLTTVIKKEESRSSQEVPTKKKLRKTSKKKLVITKLKEPSKANKPAKAAAPVAKLQPLKKPNKLIKPKSKINLLSSENIIKVFEANEWYSIKDIIKKLKITDLKDARYLQLKIKQLSRERKLLITIKSGKQYWKKK